MLGIVHTLVAFVIAISILVVVHEFGHYWVAKRLGVKVLRFSVGFGKPIWSRRFGRDRTEWALAAIPLGGYVKMLDEHEGEVPKAEQARAFNRQPIWKRAAIVVAGPLFNFLFAIVVYSMVFGAGVDGLRPLVGRVADGSLAQRAGFQPGDEFLSIDGRPVRSWDERRLYMYDRAIERATVRFTVRDAAGTIQERRLDLSSLTPTEVGSGLLEHEIGLSPALPEAEPVFDLVDEHGTAARAGLHVGDRVIAIDDQPVKTWLDVSTIVSAHPGATLRFRIERGGKQQDFPVAVKAVESGGKRYGLIGVGARYPAIPPSMLVTVRYTPFEAVVKSTETIWRMSALTLKMLGKMLMLEVSTKTISGPLTIAQYAGASAQIGLSTFAMFLAAVSISLGVLNLLPVPVLDGGHLLFYLIEGIKGSPLSERAMQWGQQIGVGLLVALMSLAMYNDLMRLLR